MREKILEKYQKLIQEISTAIALSEYGERWPDITVIRRTMTEAMNLIKKTCGENSDYYLNLQKLNNEFHPNAANQHKGVIEAAYNDYKDGFANLDSLVRAEIFEDFLTMAEYLLEQGFHVPAASLAGGVLEDSLRKLCDKNNIPYPEKTKINSLSTDLVKAGVLNALVAKEITAKADIRNNADHGNYDQFNKDDVKTMVEWIRRFVIGYL